MNAGCGDRSRSPAHQVVSERRPATMVDTRLAVLKKDQGATPTVMSVLANRLEAVAVQIRDLQEQTNKNWEKVRSQLVVSKEASHEWEGNKSEKEQTTVWIGDTTPRAAAELKHMPVDRGNKPAFPNFDGSNLEEWVHRSERYFDWEQTLESKKLRLASVYMYGKALQWHFTFLRNRGRGDMPMWTEYVETLMKMFGKAVFEDPMVRLEPTSLLDKGQQECADVHGKDTKEAERGNSSEESSSSSSTSNDESDEEIEADNEADGTEVKHGGVKAEEEMDEKEESEIREANEQTMFAEKDFTESEKDGDVAHKMVVWSDVENETNGFEWFSDKAKKTSRDRRKTIDRIGVGEGETVADEVGIVSDDVSPEGDEIKEWENAFSTEDGDKKEIANAGDNINDYEKGEDTLPNLDASSGGFADVFREPTALPPNIHFIIKTDYKILKYWLEQRHHNESRFRWLTKLMGYEEEMCYKQGKVNKATDALPSVQAPEIFSMSFMQYQPTLLDRSKQSWTEDMPLQSLLIPGEIYYEVSMNFIEGIPKSQGRDVIMVVAVGDYQFLQGVVHELEGKESDQGTIVRSNFQYLSLSSNMKTSIVFVEDVSTLSDMTKIPAPACTSNLPDSCSRPCGVLVAHPQEHCVGVNDISVPTDHSFVSASDDRTIKVWYSRKLEKDISFGSRLTYHLEGRRVLGAAMFRNTAQVVVGTCDGTIHMFSVDYISRGLGKMLEKYSGIVDIKKKETNEGAILSILNYCPDNNSGQMVMYSSHNSGIHLWDIKSNENAWSLETKAEVGYVSSLVAGPWGNWLVSGSSRGVLTLWRSEVPYPSQFLAILFRLSHGDNVSFCSSIECIFVCGFKASCVCRCKIKRNLFVECRDSSCHQVMRGTNLDGDAEFSGVPWALARPFSKANSDLDLIRNVDPKYRVDELNESPLRLPGSRALLPLRGGHLLTGGTDLKIRRWDHVSPDRTCCICGPTIKGIGNDEFYETRSCLGFKLCRRGKRGNRAVTKVLTQWSDSSEGDATWEFLFDLLQKFLSCTLEDKCVHEEVDLMQGKQDHLERDQLHEGSVGRLTSMQERVANKAGLG